MDCWLLLDESLMETKIEDDCAITPCLSEQTGRVKHVSLVKRKTGKKVGYNTGKPG